MKVYRLKTKRFPDTSVGMVHKLLFEARESYMIKRFSFKYKITKNKHLYNKKRMGQ